MKNVVAFGEIMLRLAPKGYQRFIQAQEFEVTYGGAEANVAVALANLNVPSLYITKLPQNDIGTAAINSLRQYGVDISMIARGGNRVGIYYLEKGISQRASNVIYDRNGSSIQEAARSDFDWPVIFQNADWFHFTGITPALGDNVTAICLDACKEAKQRGITVSCDLNYRHKLWEKDKARETMDMLCQYVDICIANEEDAKNVFDINPENIDLISGKMNKDGYSEVAKTLALQYGFEKVAISLRTSISASDNQWAGMLYDSKEDISYFSKEYDIHIADRIGSGDSFASGIIYACRKEMKNIDVIEFAVAASCLKHSVEGDFNLVSLDEILKLANGDSSGRVSR